jgi:hypothetical protein
MGSSERDWVPAICLMVVVVAGCVGLLSVKLITQPVAPTGLEMALAVQPPS